MLLGVPSPHTPALPTRIRNHFFLEIKNLALQTTSHEYSLASQTGLVLPASVPSRLSSAPSPLPNCGFHWKEVRFTWLQYCVHILTFSLLELWLVWTPSKQGPLFSSLSPGGSTGIDIPDAYRLVGRREGEPTGGIERVDVHRGNIPGVWTQLTTIHANWHDFEISNWIVKIAFLFYTSTKLWVIRQDVKTSLRYLRSHGKPQQRRDLGKQYKQTRDL